MYNKLTDKYSQPIIENDNIVYVNLLSYRQKKSTYKY